MNKMINCRICGSEIAASAKACPKCGAKNKKPVYMRVWFWLLIGFIVASIAIGAGSSSGTQSSTPTASGSASVNTTKKTVSQQSNAFSGNCGISANGEVYENMIGYPELEISIKNTSGKEISAIKFYSVPYDVYGEEIKGWTTQSHLYTDTPIAAGKSTSITYSFIEDSIKTVKLYVYSVYFADGTEWGDKDATTSTILKNGAEISVTPMK